MKKFYTVLMGAALPLLAFADGKTLPYESQFYQDDEWVVYNLNDDSSTWEDNSSSSDYSGSGYTVGKKYKYHSSNVANDWLVGPAVHLEAGKDYKVKFWRKVSSSSYEEKVKLFMGTSSTPAELLESTMLIQVEDKNGSGAFHAAAFTVPVTGDYYFGFYCYSNANMFNQYISAFQVREDVFAPAAPGNLSVTPGADRAMEATLTWTLPTTDLDGAPIPDGATYDEIRILRDGVQLNIPSLAADATEFVDGAAYGLTSGVHTYQVICVVNGAASPAATVTSKYIGPIAPMSIPFSAVDDTWGSKDDFELFWTTDKGRDSNSGSWSYTAGSTYTRRNVYVYSSTALDDWLISPELNFAEAGVYRVSIDAGFTSAQAVTTLYTGNGTTLGGYTDQVAQWNGKILDTQPLYAYITINTPAAKQLAINVATPSTGWSNLYFYDVRVEKWHIAPAQIADLSVAVISDGEQVQLTWTNPSLTNTGDQISALTKNEVYCDGELLATLTTDLTSGAEVTYLHEAPTPGVHTYKVVTYMGDTPADGTPMEVTSGWVGDETQSLPYTTYFAGTDATRPIWSGYDANGDGITFGYQASAGVNGKPTLPKVTEVTQHDDYCLSPYFEIDKPGYYSAYFRVSGGASGYLLEMGYVTDKTDVTGTFTKVGEDYSMTGSYSAINYEEQIYFDAPGRYALAIHTVNHQNPATSSDRAIEVQQLEFKYVPVTPTSPENFKAEAAPNNELKAILTWTNPTTSNFEDVVPMIGKAVISRRSGNSGAFQQIAEITEGLVAGEAFTWTDETLEIPGIYRYQVALEGPDGKNSLAYSQATTAWVGPGLPLPMGFNINDGDPGYSSADWTIHNVNDDFNSWSAITWEVYSGYVSITSNNAADTDDWAIHGFYQFDKGDEYKITVQNSTNSDTTSDWDLWLGSTSHYDDMHTKVATVSTPEEKYVKERHSYILVVTDEEQADTPATQAEGDDAALPRVNVKPGATSIGFHLGQPGQVTVSGVAIEVLHRAVSGVAISQAEAELLPGGTMALTAEVLPADASDKTITWSSSDEAVATVDADGNVTAVAPGQAEITATSNGFSATCALTVNPIVAESVTLSQTEGELTEGETLRLSATVAPDDTTDKTVTWTSSDDEVATVDADGLVTAVAPGTATITAACGEAQATCEITVIARVIAVTGISLDQTAIFGAPGQSQQLTATVMPEDATDKTVTWTTSDATVATVDANGMVTFVADGEATVTAACGEFTATCAVKVVSSGLALIPADMRQDARAYTLQGVEVNPDNLTSGFYIITYIKDGERVSSKIRL